MKEQLRAVVLQLVAEKWVGKYELVDILEHQYGYSLIFLNKGTQNRFSPTLLPHSLVQKVVVRQDDQARIVLEKEIETAFVKELISG